jgi:hypothetical protein
MNKRVSHGICCPDLSCSGRDEDFFIPNNCCPNRLETVQLPSPTSSLAKEELDKLRERIETANELLLELGLGERDQEDIEHDFHKVFQRLHGLFVNIRINRTSAPVRKGTKTKRKKKRLSTLRGCVEYVGKDFLILQKDTDYIIVPYEKIKYIELDSKRNEKEHQVLEIGPKLRRALTFNFGKVVSQTPSLLLHFFLINLEFFLNNFEIKNVIIFNNRSPIKGRILHADELEMIIKNGRIKKSVKLKNVDFILFK